MIPDARELHRVIAASVRELLETTRLERQVGMVDDVSSLTDAQRGELLPNIVRLMLAAFLEAQTR